MTRRVLQLLAAAALIFTLWSITDSPPGPHDDVEFTPATVGPPVTVDMEGETS